MKNCTKCGEINTTDTKFCVKCGNDTFISDDDVVCPKCGMTNVTESQFCIGCGEPLEDAKTKKQIMQSINESAEAHPREIVIKEPAVDGANTCLACGAKLKINDVFCTSCGNVVADNTQNKVLKRKLCPKCGKPNDINAVYCSYCFTDIADGEIEEYAIDFIEAARSGDETIKQAVLVSGSGKKSRICPNCGTVNEIEQPYCVKCGYKLTVDLAKKYCLVCGTENNYDAKFCVKCQYAFSGKNLGQMQASWKCASCGELNDVESNFCSKCGVKRQKR